jgi:hypothetical protein
VLGKNGERVPVSNPPALFSHSEDKTARIILRLAQKKRFAVTTTWAGKTASVLFRFAQGASFILFKRVMKKPATVFRVKTAL